MTSAFGHTRSTSLGALVVVGIVILGTTHIPVDADDRPMDCARLRLRRRRGAGTGVLAALARRRRRRSLRSRPRSTSRAATPAARRCCRDRWRCSPSATPRLGGSAGSAAAGYVAVAAVARLVVRRRRDQRAAGPRRLGVGSGARRTGDRCRAPSGRGQRRERRAHAQEQALTNERLRIARDLHDSVAHAMATINVQSGVAAHLLDRDPAQAKRALEAIRAASSDALDELDGDPRRCCAAGSTDDVAPRAPVGTLGRCRRAGRAGPRRTASPSTLRVHGDVGRSVPSVSSAAYRVVQEALTNARRHAGLVGARTRSTSPSATDGTPDRPRQRRRRWPARATAALDASIGGFGLLGMRERVESTGGLAAAPDPRAGRRLRGRRQLGVNGGRDHGSSSPTIRCSCAPGSGPCSTPRTTSRSSARRAPAPRPSRSPLDRRPDVVLMDIRMPDVDGLDRRPPDRRGRRPRRASRCSCSPRSSSTSTSTRRCGPEPVGFLVKHTEPAELIRAVRVVADGEALLSPA